MDKKERVKKEKKPFSKKRLFIDLGITFAVIVAAGFLGALIGQVILNNII